MSVRLAGYPCFAEDSRAVPVLSYRSQAFPVPSNDSQAIPVPPIGSQAIPFRPQTIIIIAIIHTIIITGKITLV